MKTRLILCSLVSFLGLACARGDEDAVWRKLEEWKVPSVDFKQMELGEAVVWLRAKSREIDPVGEGRKAGILLGYERRRHREPDRLITFKAENITFGALLTEIGRQADRTVEIHEDGVVLRMPGAIPVVEGLVERTYRVPPGFFHISRDEGHEDDPFAAAETDGHGEVRVPSVREILEAQGITFAEGASARRAHGPTGELLVVTNTPDQLELVEAMIDSILDGGYLRQMRIQAEIYATETARALGLARDADNPTGAALLLRDLGDLVAAGEAELIGCPMVLTRSGQKAKVESGSAREIITGYVGKDGKDVAETERVHSGAMMEVEAVIGADGYHIELNIMLDVGTVEPKLSRSEMLAPVSGERVPVESVEKKGLAFQTAINTVGGQAQFLGVTPSGADSGKSFLVFATVSILDVRSHFPVPE